MTVLLHIVDLGTPAYILRVGSTEVVMEQFINPIERSLLTDLVGLYTDDLASEGHAESHHECLACAKQAIIDAIAAYERLDSIHRARAKAEDDLP